MKKNFKEKRKLIAAKRLTSVLVTSTILTAGLTTTSHASNRETLKATIKLNNDKIQKLTHEKEKINKKIKEEKQEIAELENKIFDIFKNLKQSSFQDLNKKIEEFKNDWGKSSDFQKVLNDNSKILYLLKKKIYKLYERDMYFVNFKKIFKKIIDYNNDPNATGPFFYKNDTGKLKDLIINILKNLENIPDAVEMKKQIIEYLALMAKNSDLYQNIDEIFFKPEYKSYLQSLDMTKYSSCLVSAQDLYNVPYTYMINKNAFFEIMSKYLKKIVNQLKKTQNQIAQLQTLFKNFEVITKLLQNKLMHLQNLEKLEKELKKNQKELDEIIEQKDKLESLPYSDQKSSDPKKVNLKVGKQQNDSNKKVDDCKAVQNQKEKDLDINNKKKIEDKEYNTVPFKINGKDGNKSPSSKSKPKTGVNSNNWSLLTASSLMVAAIGLFLSKFLFKKRKLSEISN
ncbi:MAG: hypothetical protein LBT82_00470 [Oscillospiraceae bacterium]|jgi:chromosome segregation ATPase|nr:hypothetical protein [Oscillospiraceae bacterium]